MHWIYAHLIGDFIIQTDWMAREKKQRAWPCVAHVLTYLAPFMLVKLAWWQIALIGLQHFIRDRTELVSTFMRKTGKAGFAEPPTAPWSVILVDQIVHILFLGLIIDGLQL